MFLPFESEVTTHHQLSEAGRVMANWTQKPFTELLSYALEVKEMWRLVFRCAYYHTKMCMHTHACIWITQ